MHRWWPAVAALMLVMSPVGCGTSGRIGPTVVDPDAPTEFTQTESGLKYRILRRGDGSKPTAASKVTVDYRGWLDNGRTFDQSYNRPKPVTFSLANVVPGWTEGMQYVREGGMIEMVFPPELGYGDKTTGGIPANSTLHFRVELHKVQ